MRERASELGGTLLVSPTPAGVGTLIRMELP
jgi:signal transduction histidine kinase